MYISSSNLSTLIAKISPFFWLERFHLRSGEKISLVPFCTFGKSAWASKPRNICKSTINQPVQAWYCWAHLHCREVVDLMQTQFIYCTGIMKSIIFQCSSNNLSTLVLDLELIKLKHQQQEKHQSTSHRHQTTIATPSSSTIHHNHGFQALCHQRIHIICYLEEPMGC